MDAHGMPIRVLITSGVAADCTKASDLIERIETQYFFVDRGYDSNVIVDQARQQGMQVVIPLKKNRKEQREYGKYLYKIRHLVKNAFLHLKRWR
jgi:transposase